MPDIFDQIAPAQAQAPPPSGDIFDQISASPTPGPSAKPAFEDAGTGYSASKLAPEPEATAQSRFTRTPIAFGQTYNAPDANSASTLYNDAGNKALSIEANFGSDPVANSRMLRHESIHGMLVESPADYRQVAKDPAVAAAAASNKKRMLAAGYKGDIDRELPAYLGAFSNSKSEWTGGVTPAERNAYVEAYAKALSKQDPQTAAKYRRMLIDSSPGTPAAAINLEPDSPPDPETYAPGVPKPPLPSELQGTVQPASFQNPRTGRISPRTMPGQGTPPENFIDMPITGTQKAVEGVQQMEQPGLRAKAGGAAKIIGGGLEALTPFMAVTGVGGVADAAVTLGGREAAKAAAGITASLAAGALTQAGTEKALKSLDTPEEYTQLAGVLAGIAGTSAGAVGGYLKNAAFRGMLKSILQDRLNKEYARTQGKARTAQETASTGPAATPQVPGEVAKPPAENIQDAEWEPVGPQAAAPAAEPGWEPVESRPEAEPDATPPAVTREHLKPGASFDTPVGPAKVISVKGGLVQYADSSGNENKLPVKRFLKLVSQTPAAPPVATPAPAPVPQANIETAPTLASTSPTAEGEQNQQNEQPAPTPAPTLAKESTGPVEWTKQQMAAGKEVRVSAIQRKFRMGYGAANNVLHAAGAIKPEPAHVQALAEAAGIPEEEAAKVIEQAGPDHPAVQALALEPEVPPSVTENPEIVSHETPAPPENQALAVVQQEEKPTEVAETSEEAYARKLDGIRQEVKGAAPNLSAADIEKVVGRIAEKRLGAKPVETTTPVSPPATQVAPPKDVFDAAAEPEKPVAKKPSLAASKKAERERQRDRLKSIYTPGNVITGYGGQVDKVLAFKENPDGGFLVTVQESKPDGTPVGNVRTHSTFPDKNAKILAHVPVEKPEVKAPEPEKAVESESGQPTATERKEQAVPEPGGSGNSSRYGQATAVRVPSENRAFESRYAIRELDDVVPSHNPFTLQANPAYKFRNDRNYADPRNAERILKQTTEFDPEYVVTESPDANNGAPVIDSAGNVLGGNSRAMTIARVYKQRPEAAAGYKKLLSQKAAQFGLTSEEVAAMKQPVLVRELTREVTPESAQDIITDLNKVGTAALTGPERAIADSNRISPETLEQFAGMIDALGPSGTLAKALEGKGGTFAANLLVKDGVITTSEKPSLFSGDGTLTPAAKERIGKLLLGRLFDDSAQFEGAPPSLRNKLERIVAPLSRVAGKPDWDLLPEVKSAIRMIEVARSTGNANLDDLVAQQGLFGGSEEYSPRTIELVKFISDNGPVKLAQAFNRYANDSRGPTMFGEVKPDEAFADAFGAEKDQEGMFGSERGSAPMLTDLANGAYEGIQKFFDDHGKSADVVKRNLNFVSKHAPELDAAALKASGWKGLAAAIMYSTTPAMDEALQGSRTGADVEEVFQMLQEGRLRGIRDGLWKGTAQEISEMDDDEMAKSFDSRLTRLLDAIEGRQGLPGDLSQAAAARFERDDMEDLREFLVDTFWDTADRVATAMPDDRFQQMMDDPHVNRAVKVYKQNAEPAMKDVHEEHEGILSKHLGPVHGGTYIPLVPLKEEEIHPGGVGMSTPYIKPKNQANRMATGLSSGYDPSLPTFRKTLERRTHASAKFDLLRHAEDTGWLKPVGRDDDPRVFTDKHGNEWPAAVREMAPAKTLIRPGQKPVPVGKRFGVMPKILANELDVILDGPDYDEAPNRLGQVIHKMNSFALAGLAVMESVFHSKNLSGGIVQNMPAVLATLGEMGYRKFTGDAQKVTDVMNSSPSSGSFAQDLVKMGRLGLLADRFGETSYSKRMADLLGNEGSVVQRFSFAPALFGPHGLDIMARWLLFKAKEARDPNYSARDMADYVNQLGIYVNGQQSKFVKFMRRSGFNPFAVAGTAGIGRGLRSLVGGRPPVSAKRNPGKFIGWSLLHMLTVGAIGSIIYWEMTHKAVTGRSPIKDPRAKPNKIPLPSSLRNSKWAQALAPGSGTLYLDMQFANPDIGRGLRATGLEGGFTTWNAGGNTQQIAEAALLDMLNTFTGTLTGPALKSIIAAAGNETHINSLLDAQGGNETRLMSSLPRKNIPFKTFGHTFKGAPANVGWRARAAAMQLNSMFGMGAEAIGVLPRNPDEKKEATLPRSVVDTVLPGLVAGPNNPFAAATRVQKQRAGMGH